MDETASPALRESLETRDGMVPPDDRVKTASRAWQDQSVSQDHRAAQDPSATRVHQERGVHLVHQAHQEAPEKWVIEVNPVG